MEIKPDIWSHSSDHFELILQMCEKLLKEGKAYVDDTDTETMRKEREERKESKNRSTGMVDSICGNIFSYSPRAKFVFMGRDEERFATRNAVLCSDKN